MKLPAMGITAWVAWAEWACNLIPAGRPTALFQSELGFPGSLFFVPFAPLTSDLYPSFASRMLP